MNKENDIGSINGAFQPIEQLTAALDNLSEEKLVAAYRKGQLILQEGEIHNTSSPLAFQEWGVEGVMWS